MKDIIQNESLLAKQDHNYKNIQIYHKENHNLHYIDHKSNISTDMQIFETKMS